MSAAARYAREIEDDYTREREVRRVACPRASRVEAATWAAIRATQIQAIDVPLALLWFRASQAMTSHQDVSEGTERLAMAVAELAESLSPEQEIPF